MTEQTPIIYRPTDLAQQRIDERATTLSAEISSSDASICVEKLEVAEILGKNEAI